jgi:hypothetical protein
MPRVGFKITMLLFEMAKAFHVLKRMAAVFGTEYYTHTK